MHHGQFSVAAAMVAVVLAGAQPAAAQEYTAKPVKVVATFTPDGGAGLTAHLTGNRLPGMWRQQQE